MSSAVRRFITAANVVVFTGVAIGTPTSTHAQHAARNRFTDFDRFVSQTLKQYGVPGTAIAVVENGKVVFVKGFGVRNVTKRGPVDANTIFQLASVTKVFTAAAAATVVDDGKLSWDAPVRNYLPQFEFYEPYVTRH